MDGTKPLHKFLQFARGQGATDEILVGLLRGRGWPEQDVYRALADHYEASSEATWTIGLGSVMFTLIDQWVKDPLSPNRYYGGAYYQIASSLACVIVAFPVYIFLMRYIVRELEVHPEKADSAVRKWLTYIALLIAAGVVFGDLITFLTFFLRGELTARFIAKAVVVLMIAGGIFWYYIGSLQKGSASEEDHEPK